MTDCKRKVVDIFPQSVYNKLIKGGAYMNLGEKIYTLRTKSNMSQGALADALDVSRQSISKWENNTSVPELEKLIKMSKISAYHSTS